MAVLMKTKGIVVIFGVLSLLVSGCYYGRGLTYAEGGTLMGALYGAGLGAAIGSATGHAGEGAGIGALAGSLIGGAIGYGMEGPYRTDTLIGAMTPITMIPTTMIPTMGAITTPTPGTRITGGPRRPAAYDPYYRPGSRGTIRAVYDPIPYEDDTYRLGGYRHSRIFRRSVYQNRIGELNVPRVRHAVNVFESKEEITMNWIYANKKRFRYGH